eukprot:TRINITY_DN56617_c0_g1_i1.p1 TRINITY_DN56617_c0_g1~~TRINITY_DN56617_c0_g1_i1.p1  ORF type:complete len:386 (-),score=105.75 TRINITY_DN56617_c0_g1_i1:199-1284(-)
MGKAMKKQTQTFQPKVAAAAKGGKAGGKAGSWVFVPASAPAGFAAKIAGKGAPSKFQGKGNSRVPVISKFSGNAKGGAKGNGKANSNLRAQVMANINAKKGMKCKVAPAAPEIDKARLDKVQKIDPSCKVWIGGLNQTTSWKKLEGLFKDVVKPTNTVLMRKGTAVVSFKTAEDADAAISTFNGSELDGKSIQVDVWTQKEKTDNSDKKQKKKQKKPVGKEQPVRKVVSVGTFAKKALQPKAKALAAQGKKKEASKADLQKEKMKEKLKEVDHACKAWVGDLPKDVTFQQVKQHFKEMGIETKLCVLGKPGVACVTFESPEEAESAIVTANGTEFKGNAIQVDAWTMPERKDKKRKKEAAQ